MEQLAQYLKFAPNLNSSQLFALLAVVGVLLFVLTLGRTRSLVSLLAIYVAFMIQTVFPFFGAILKRADFARDLATLRVIVFLALYAIVFGLLNRSVLRARFNMSEASFSSVFIVGLIQLGLIVSIILNLAPSFYNINQKIPAAVLPYFNNQSVLFYWSLLPLVIFFFQKRK
ncbi:MAG: hypothetical protein UY20_C0001G0005 [Candidatus Yanofskybacteria bacterium GW2011_GWA1_48_10]|uniref:Colicin V production protein n=2 Tax=Candidatus Yanofskyibacteriota TaxID=1752733 RepID=A0A0G1U7V2_9BACT|nr:MAG: hypothetical protein UY20_C0001G0005 [Candidatus Yanofskybacteria bacterium GW2011_GWA1_48_10]OGN06572.1 MAG: hypothetical protein A2669_02930 [Candidatus Yanofskybacteria bacterium RIFCSPHIGHO2_01_FULL_48_25b]